jgi:hypothetical protein
MYAKFFASATVGFVGRDAELGKALDALSRGNNLLVKGKPGIGKSAFLRRLYKRSPKDRPCLWAGDRNAKALLVELFEQTHQRVGVAVPARLLSPRIKSKALTSQMTPPRMQYHRPASTGYEESLRNPVQCPPNS